MLRPLTASTERFLANLEGIQRRVETAQQQISSGRRLVRPSDDPDQVTTMLQARADLEQTRQIRKDLGRVKTEVDTAEHSLQQTALLLDRIKVLGTQGVNGTQTPESRASIAIEIEALFGQLVNISRTSVDGRYIFSGDGDLAPPYSVDLSKANGVTAYAGSVATRAARHPSGTTFTIAKTAQEIFDSSTPGNNIFAAVNSLRTALMAGDETAMKTALGDLTTSSTHLNSMLAYYGSGQNQVEEATNFAANLEVRLQAELSVIQDADLTSAILELQQGQIAQEAALTSRAQMPKRSLFDFL